MKHFIYIILSYVLFVSCDHLGFKDNEIFINQISQQQAITEREVLSFYTDKSETYIQEYALEKCVPTYFVLFSNDTPKKGCVSFNITKNTITRQVILNVIETSNGWDDCADMGELIDTAFNE